MQVKIETDKDRSVDTLHVCGCLCSHMQPPTAHGYAKYQLIRTFRGIAIWMLPL